MALTNTQYDTIIREYDDLRINARKVADERTAYIYEHVDGFKELDEAIVNVSLDCAKKKLAGDASALDELHSLLADLKSMKASLLKGAGYPEDYLEPVCSCPDCKDTGYINGSKCHCFIKKISDILYDSSNIRELLSENNFDTLSFDYYTGEDLERFKRAVSECHRLVDNFDESHGNIMFYGTVGTGKSFLSDCIAKALLDKGKSCIYFSAIGLFEQIAKETFHSSSKDELYNLYDYLYNCDCLIVDDLGTETTNSFISSQLFSLINERNLRNKSTVISTNLSLEDIRDRYSDRVFSRIVSSFTTLRLSGSDIRILKKANVRK